MIKKVLTILVMVTLSILIMVGCDSPQSLKLEESDKQQNKQQEVLLKESVSQIGMPGIKNFREKKMMKTILELRDQEGLVTYTYLENMIPTIIKGKTALGGKLTFFGKTVGYGLPYATQFTNPTKVEWKEGFCTQGVWGGSAVTAQADPNGLFSPASAEGTWVLMKNPDNDSETLPIYIESKIVVSPFRLKKD